MDHLASVSMKRMNRYEKYCHWILDEADPESDVHYGVRKQDDILDEYRPYSTPVSSGIA